MKKWLLAILFVSFGAVASDEQASVEEVRETYQYCKEYVEEEKITSGKDAALLTCVNEELSESGYKTFASLAELLAYIKE
ncbi:hypothetical protein [Thalassotalea fusca]